MASSLRRNTFVVSNIAAAAPLMPVAPVSGMDRQNLMRLKVNRVALLQELRVEHVIGSLCRQGILTEQDFRKIEKGRTPQDRARILIDILPTKNKDSEWYKCFRRALLNPEGGKTMKHRYRSLVEFLDNTLIHRPTSQAGKFSEATPRKKEVQYPRYQALPHIQAESPSECNILNFESSSECNVFNPENSSESNVLKLESSSESNVLNADISLESNVLNPEIPSESNVLNPEISSESNVLNPDISSETNVLNPEISLETNVLKPESSSESNVLNPAISSECNVLNPESSLERNVLNLEGEEIRESSTFVVAAIPDQDKVSEKSDDNLKSVLLVKGFFHQWIHTPDNFRSLIALPTSLHRTLEEENTPESLDQLRQEQTAIHYVQALEIMSALSRRRQLPAGFELCMCDAVQELLSKPELYHLYIKHFRVLQEAEVDVLADVASSYETVLAMLSGEGGSTFYKQVVGVGFRFVELLAAMEMYALAETVVVKVIDFLRANPAVENWIDEYKAHLCLMGVRNEQCDLQGAQRSYFAASQLMYQIQMVSFGQKLLYEGGVYQELSSMMLESGAVNTAHGWARKALQDVDGDDAASVVRVASQAVMTHCAVWQVHKAQKLAIFAVQFAYDKFGKYHPLYLKALNSLCHVFVEFEQDETAMTLATDLLELTERVYNCDTLHLALAHRMLSKALMARQAYHINDAYYQHAMEAVRIARSILPENHPLLHPYQANFALALQWKSLHCPQEVRDSTLRWAETEAKSALNMVIHHYGDTSLRTAQIHTLLGQIYSKMSQLSLAERHLLTAVEFLQVCQPKSSHYLLLAHATLAAFLAATGRHDKAIHHFKQVVMVIESTGYYLKWVHVCFQTLIQLLQAQGANFTNSQEAERLEEMLSIWLKDNPKEESTFDPSQLTLTPPLFKDFLDKFDAWGSAVQKIHHNKDSLKDPDEFAPESLQSHQRS